MEDYFCIEIHGEKLTVGYPDNDNEVEFTMNSFYGEEVYMFMPLDDIKKLYSHLEKILNKND